MLHVSIDGADQREANILYNAYFFALKELMPRKQNLDVEIALTDIEGDADGFHMEVEKNVHEIEIQKGLIEEDMITALFHEMVHVRQHARGWLKDKGPIKTWMGEDYIAAYSTVDEYMALPWEAEAYKLQEELYAKWNTRSDNH